MRIRVKKRTLKLLAVAVVVVAILAFVFRPQSHVLYSTENGLFQYSSSRPVPIATLLNSNQTENYSQAELVLSSRDAKLSAFYFSPSKVRAGVVLLAGAGVDKKGNSGLARFLADDGFAVLSYDQRGTGKTIVERETPIEPDSHKEVYDALAAADYLRSKGVSPILLIGESMGGRTAIMAAAMDKRILGAVGISTSGYGNVADPAYYAINPDNYLPALSGRKVAFIHSTADTVIPIQYAQQTFAMAPEPKNFFQITGCTHGYCPEMKSKLMAALDWVLNATE